MDNIKYTAQRLFFAVTFILSCFTMNSDNLQGYLSNNGTVFIFFKLAMIITFVFIATTINKKSIKFIADFSPIAVIVITIILIFDYYVTNLSGSQFLFRVWWIASIFTAEGTLFLSVLINKPSKKDYALFYKKFWYGFTPLYLFVLIICFLRFPSTTRTINVIPGSGTFLMLKAFINNVNVSFEAPLIFFGNLLIFVPLPFILSAFFKKLKPYQIILIGIIFPILVESYQYIFRCGDVDVDDLILNWIGFFIGLAVQIKANIKYSN